MNWPPYPAYQKSGVGWLGDVPTSWNLKRLKHGFRRVQRPFDPGAETVTAFRDGVVTARSNRRIDGFTEADKYIGYQGIEKGDLAIHAMDGFAGAIGVSDSSGKCSPVVSVCRHETGANPYYFAHILRHVARSGYLTAIAKGIRERSTDFRWADAKDLFVPNPPESEQQAIVSFLDRETAKIDALIAKQEQLIATLREDRTATITHVVTKGLDPDASMSDSGIQGLGSVPAGWSVRPFLRCVQSRVDYRGATPKKVDDGIVLVTARNVRPGWIDYGVSEEYVSAEEYDEIMRRGLPKIDDLLFTMEAPLGNAALVDRTDIALAQRIIKFRPDSHVVLPRYLLYSVMGEWFQSQLVARATGSTALGLKASKLPELRLAVPDLEEQSLIVGFLDKRSTEIDELVAKAVQVIDTLREYRSALITDAVTGKIDVREAA